MPVTEATYRTLAEEDFESGWELVCGRLRRKPGMTLRHNTIQTELGYQLRAQLAPTEYAVSVNAARLRLPSGDHFVPDVVVVPAAAREAKWDETGVEAYPEPMPLVIEVWSPSTGDYDVTEKVHGYQQRGDLEIWLVDLRTRSVRVIRRQAEGTYTERNQPRGGIRVASLPGVTLDLDAAFRQARL